MRISKIERQKKHKDRYSIYIDEHFELGIGEEVLINFALYKGQEVDDDFLNQLRTAESKHKLYSSALNYLSYGLRSVQEMRTYLNQLSQKEYGLSNEHAQEIERFIEPTIDRLTQMGYLNDFEYAKSYVRTAFNLKSHGPRLIAMDLRKKGINKHTIMDAMEEYDEDQQQEIMEKVSDKFLRTKTNLPPKALKGKLYQHLTQKGFEKNLIDPHLSQLDMPVDEDRQTELLAKQAEKYLRKYHRRHQGYELKHKISQGLYSKGFDYDLIQYWLDDHLDEINKEDNE